MLPVAINKLSVHFLLAIWPTLQQQIALILQCLRSALSRHRWIVTDVIQIWTLHWLLEQSRVLFMRVCGCCPTGRSTTFDKDTWLNTALQSTLIICRFPDVLHCQRQQSNPTALPNLPMVDFREGVIFSECLIWLLVNIGRPHCWRQKKPVWISQKPT